MIRIALYQPDIPQNLGAAIRLCACLGLALDVIEPCGFIYDDRKIHRAAMDYGDGTAITRHVSWKRFLDLYQGRQRLVLLSTKAAQPYAHFAFAAGDILLAGRESAGVPDDVHKAADARIVVPMPGGGRSLNVVNSLAMVAGEALRQTGGFEI